MKFLPIKISLWIVLALFGVACSSTKEQSSTSEKGTNIAGVFESSPKSYKRVSPTTFDVHTDQLSKQDDFSGDQTTLLWGALTIADY